MAEKTYDVLREHDGDRFYRTGESRVLDEGAATELVRLGVLAEAKAEGAPANKAEGKARANKAAKA